MGAHRAPPKLNSFSLPFLSSHLLRSNDTPLIINTKTSYDYLIVAPGLQTDLTKIPGLTEALQDRSSKVSTIYKEDSVEQVWSDIQQFEGGKAVSFLSSPFFAAAGAEERTGQGGRGKLMEFCAGR